MSSSWRFDEYEVIKPREGEKEWWHIYQRFMDIDSGERYYKIYDATHSDWEHWNAFELEDIYESARWKCRTKPAAKRGWRVNGHLCGPSTFDYWKGTACRHDYECPECGESSDAGLDIIIQLSGDKHHTKIVCRKCSNEWWDIESSEAGGSQ